MPSFSSQTSTEESSWCMTVILPIQACGPICGLIGLGAISGAWWEEWAFDPNSSSQLVVGWRAWLSPSLFQGVRLWCQGVSTGTSGLWIFSCAINFRIHFTFTSPWSKMNHFVACAKSLMSDSVILLSCCTKQVWSSLFEEEVMTRAQKSKSYFSLSHSTLAIL